MDYRQNGRSINGEYYDNILDQFAEDFKDKRPYLVLTKLFFFQINETVNLQEQLW